MRTVLAVLLVLSLSTAPTARGASPPVAVPPASAAARLTDLATRADRELHANILPFWMQHVVHPDRGGFYGEVGPDLAPDDRAPRGALMTSRILWTFSAASRHDSNQPHFRAMADRAFADLIATFWDTAHGGLFWTASPDGRPLAQHKQVYLQSFGIYALSEYHRATGHGAALDHARTIFRRLEDHARDAGHGGYFEAFSRDWSRELPEMRRTIGGTAPKSQNTHLHVMEAYTNLLRAWPDPEVRAALAGLVGLMLDRILDPETHHLGLYFEADWSPASDAVSYGHDIEAAWLLCDAADALDDRALQARVRTAAVALARATLARGVAPSGGVYLEGGPAGVTRADFEWWAQAEAVVGFLAVYEISGDPVFLDAATRTWDFIEIHVVDGPGREWHLMLDPEGRPRPGRPKASLWKCPYHNGRACMEIAARVKALVPP